MKSIVLDEIGRGYFTNLNDIFIGIDNIEAEYNFLISDYSCNIYPSNIIKNDSKYIWVTGDELRKIVKENDIQFIWCVLSAFNKKIKLEDILEYPLPYAENNSQIWRDQYTIQNPLAEFEVISFDSSYLIFTARDETINKKFIMNYPECKSMDSYLHE